MDSSAAREGFDWWGLAQFVLGFVVAPFAITGLYRMLPTWVPTWPAPAFVLLLAVGLYLWRQGLRKLSIGIATGALLHALLLAYLFWEWSRSLDF